MTALDYVAASGVAIAALLGVLLTFATLPGTWLMALIAGLLWWWRPDLFTLPSFIAALIVAALAEVAEFIGGSVGAGARGAGRAGVIGGLVGALVGAIAGTILLAFLPLIGTIIGAVIGAGVGAGIGERGAAGRSWAESAKIGVGAASGRLISVFVKGAFAIVMALILVIAAFVP
ncbi:MAG: DUF456 family protein [Planctomycetota bacterium]